MTSRSVHEATTLALKGMTLEGRALEFLHAYSATEARTILANNPDLAVGLLDVVMESPTPACSSSASSARNSTTRRCASSCAPASRVTRREIDTIRTYDINDYKTKSELTRIRLFTSLTVAIRSYWQIHCLEANRRGLQLIVAASTELSRPRGLIRFAEGVVTELCAPLGVAEESNPVRAAGGTASSEPYILAAAGCYSEWIGVSPPGVSDGRVRTALEKILKERSQTSVRPPACTSAFQRGCRWRPSLDVRHALSELDHNLLEVFCGNIAVAFENTHPLHVSANSPTRYSLLTPNRNRFRRHRPAAVDQRPPRPGLPRRLCRHQQRA